MKLCRLCHTPSLLVLLRRTSTTPCHSLHCHQQSTPKQCCMAQEGVERLTGRLGVAETALGQLSQTSDAALLALRDQLSAEEVRCPASTHVHGLKPVRPAPGHVSSTHTDMVLSHGHCSLHVVQAVGNCKLLCDYSGSAQQQSNATQCVGPL